MPQLDYYIFVSQIVWLLVVFFGLYGFLSEWVIPMLYEWNWLRQKLEEVEKKTGDLQKDSVVWMEKGELLFFSYVSSSMGKVQESVSYKLKKK